MQVLTDNEFIDLNWQFQDLLKRSAFLIWIIVIISMYLFQYIYCFKTRVLPAAFAVPSQVLGQYSMASSRVQSTS